VNNSVYAGLLTDRYELTMLSAALRDGTAHRRSDAWVSPHIAFFLGAEREQQQFVRQHRVSTLPESV